MRMGEMDGMASKEELKDVPGQIQEDNEETGRGW